MKQQQLSAAFLHVHTIRRHVSLRLLNHIMAVHLDDDGATSIIAYSLLFVLSVIIYDRWTYHDFVLTSVYVTIFAYVVSYAYTTSRLIGLGFPL